MSAEHAGLTRGYVNERVPLGPMDVGPVVLGIKESGADVLYTLVLPDTAFALVAGLRQAGVQMKSVLLATGYGADLLESPPAIGVAQGIGFLTSYSPVEMNNDATRAWSAALKQIRRFGEWAPVLLHGGRLDQRGLAHPWAGIGRMHCGPGSVDGRAAHRQDLYRRGSVSSARRLRAARLLLGRRTRELLVHLHLARRPVRAGSGWHTHLRRADP